MSVTTTADERIRSAKEHIDAAYKDLLQVVNPDTWGHTDFKEEYMDGVLEVLPKLLEIKRKL